MLDSVPVISRDPNAGEKISYPTVMATKEIIGAFEPPVTTLPTTLVIDRQGVIRHQHPGLISFDDLKEKVVKLL